VVAQAPSPDRRSPADFQFGPKFRSQLSQEKIAILFRQLQPSLLTRPKPSATMRKEAPPHLFHFQWNKWNKATPQNAPNSHQSKHFREIVTFFVPLPGPVTTVKNKSALARQPFAGFENQLPLDRCLP
jgi:hypothetical protein